MAVQQVVIHVSGGTNTFNIPLPNPAELGPQVSEEEERATATAFLATVRSSTQEDVRRGRINEEGAQVLDLVPSTDGEEQDAALRMGESLIQWGDAIQNMVSAVMEDEAVNEFVDAAAEGDLNTAFQKFKDMARLVLECDSNGVGN